MAQPHFTPGVPPCSCELLPVNRWYRDGVLAEIRVLSMDTGDRDAEDYDAGGYDSWTVACPLCERIYASGFQL